MPVSALPGLLLWYNAAAFKLKEILKLYYTFFLTVLLSLFQYQKKIDKCGYSLGLVHLQKKNGLNKRGRYLLPLFR